MKKNKRAKENPLVFEAIRNEDEQNRELRRVFTSISDPLTGKNPKHARW